MLLQSCHIGVLRVFSFPLGLWNKLNSFNYFLEKCKSDVWYNWCSQRRLCRLCTYWFVRIEICVLIIFMVRYSQPISLCFTKNWAGSFAAKPVLHKVRLLAGLSLLCFKHPGWPPDALGKDLPIPSAGDSCHGPLRAKSRCNATSQSWQDRLNWKLSSIYINGRKREKTCDW